LFFWGWSPLPPSSLFSLLRCCHRNFHRKEVQVLRRKRRNHPAVFLLSMLTLVALIGTIQFGLREVKESRPDHRFFVLDSFGQPHEVDESVLRQLQEGFWENSFDPPFALTGEHRPTRFWAMGEYEEQ